MLIAAQRLFSLEELSPENSCSISKEFYVPSSESFISDSSYANEEMRDKMWHAHLMLDLEFFSTTKGLLFPKTTPSNVCITSLQRICVYCSALETHQGSLWSSLPLCSKDLVHAAGGIFSEALPFPSAFVQNEVGRILNLVDVRH